jgi:DNA-binding HxlR family transcriptional regulator
VRGKRRKWIMDSGDLSFRSNRKMDHKRHYDLSENVLAALRSGGKFTRELHREIAPCIHIDTLSGCLESLLNRGVIRVEYHDRVGETKRRERHTALPDYILSHLGRSRIGSSELVKRLEDDYGSVSLRTVLRHLHKLEKLGEVECLLPLWKACWRKRSGAGTKGVERKNCIKRTESTTAEIDLLEPGYVSV